MDKNMRKKRDFIAMWWKHDKIKSKHKKKMSFEANISNFKNDGTLLDWASELLIILIPFKSLIKPILLKHLTFANNVRKN